MKNSISSYKFFLKYIIILLIIFNISRYLLVIKTGIQLDFLFFIYSLRMDLIVISFILFFSTILFTFNLILLSRLYLTFSLLIILYLELSNFFFFEEFNTRINYLFVEYLQYPKEVFLMLWVSYKLYILIFIPSIIYLSYSFFIYTKAFLISSSIIKKLLVLPLILLVLALTMRSSIDSSTPNQSFYSYSNSTIKNDITNNTIFSLLYAIYLKSKDKMPNFTNIQNNKILNIQNSNKKEYLNRNSLLHFQKSSFNKKENIVLVLMESFGKSYVGSLGGTPTTPNFDKMTKDGLFLSNMYSSSNRSNRGFEAVLSSLYPVVSNTYLKLAKSQNNFWTLARTLKNKGYKTIFLYGGDSKFDNMKGFALNNGFDQVIDKFDFSNKIKKYTWGVSDEELYKKANNILENSNKPTFLLVFTLSSHKPFDYPDNKIKYYKKAKKESFANSIKYADFALNKFYLNLKNSDFFDKGLLTIVADHNAHMLVNKKIPINEFRIPALFISKELNQRKIDTITHQIDIAPTLLDLAGVSANIPAMGNNLLKDKNSSALIVHRGSYAFLKDKKFVLYTNNKKIKVFDFKHNELKKDNKLINEGLDYIYGSYEIYNKKIHKDY